MKIEIPVNTVLFTVAPSNSGKTYLIENYLLKSLKEQYSDLNIQYISSDNIRRELLGDENIHKHDSEMLQVSQQSFDLLYFKLKQIMSFPLKSEIIIVDTTGLSEEFRNDLISLTKEKHYNLIPLVFDYDDRNDYYSFADSNTKKYVIDKHVTKLKKEVLKTLQKDKYKDVIRIKTKDFDSLNLDFKISDYGFYKTHFLDNNVEYCVISDIHGCFTELKQLIYENGCTIKDDLIEGDKVFIVQDYLDKGYGIIDTIEFIHYNTLHGKIKPLIGNHENYVYKRITNKIQPNKELDTSYFNSVELLLKSEEHKNMFIELFEKYSKHFYRHKNFFVNHAPCELKYLGKIDEFSLKKQRNFMYPKYDKNLTQEENIKIIEDALKFYTQQKGLYYNSKPIVWGHVSMRKYKTFNNVFMIDTGCVSGGKLTSISFSTDGRQFIKTVKSSISENSLLDLFSNNKEEKFYTIDMLEDSDDKARVDFLLKNKVNFISGTVSPSNKKIDTNELESLEEGLKYYKDNNISKVILEPKYMGSRCNIYLNKNIDETYCVTRNGYLVKVDYKDALKPLYELPYIKNKFDNENAKIIILDSEFMPWSAIGKGLIEHEFLAVKTGINSEFKLLKSTGFEHQLNNLIDTDKFNEFILDVKSNIKKEDLIEKYTHRFYETYKNLMEYKDEHISLDETKKYIDVYNRQMELFANFDVPMEFKPFSILKIVNNDDSEVLFFGDSNIEIFKSISNDKYQIIDFNDDNWLETAEKYYSEITEQMEMEGIVIKPEFVYNKNIAPYLKCRNPNYLSIVYGYDYQKENKYSKLLRRKSTKQKLNSSIIEFELGKKMLEQPYNTINKQNKNLISLFIHMILDDKNVQTYDPRL